MGQPAAAQMRLSVQQLSRFIESSIRLKHEDKRVADYLKRVTLTEHLDDRTVEVLQGKGAGPKTVEALRSLSVASTALPKPGKPAPKPAPVLIPPPSPEEQKKILDSVREYGLNYTKRLPDFICTQVTRRYGDPSGLEFWQSLDTITERLTYFEQKEDYKVVLVNGRPMDISHDALGGSTSSGEFGSMMKEVFEPESQTKFRWERWATLRGRRTHVFSYRILTPNSKYRVIYQRSMNIVSGYRGLIYVDADYSTVSRITLDLDDIPPTFPVQQVKVMLDYDFIKIGESEHVLPLRAEVRSREGKNLIKNEVEFRMYRKFGADAVIKFDETPEPLPAESLQEQPAAPTPPPNN
jgi:hypothetical protein